MAVRHRPVRWLLVLMVIGLVGIGAAVAVWWPLSGTWTGGGYAGRRVGATVVTSAPCGTAAASDVVEVQVDGKTRRATLDGCGHRQGETFDVELPSSVPPTGDLRVWLAGTGAAGAGPDLESRLRSVLLALAAVSGALFAFLVRRRTPTRPEPKPQPMPASAAPPTATPPARPTTAEPTMVGPAPNPAWPQPVGNRTK
ncbi:hypothetical protein [Streptoalloteichus tenebrarius]|uniref:hypothetical protein n=1 Tax=Streptoalloteichus tenebrarius (strain ATCC 17920 / DSM 40477 / JCM 4838 / CBS 697.72 / NBRC 16177 / NCIMB 11028 / NRRL B-12390 / A12253. 1 / ISP 5477) TaxID=1933 RepID=UPI0020A2E9AA|nr:hypothetical protein [Streptoalloteichus tenebrarius]